jgi:hypothetical protein
MNALSKEEIQTMADDYIDDLYKRSHGTNKMLREANDREAIRLTLAFVGGFTRGLAMVTEIKNCL